MRWTWTVWHWGVAPLLALTACDRGGATRGGEEQEGNGAGGAPSQACDKLLNAALERWVIEASGDGSYSRSAAYGFTTAP